MAKYDITKKYLMIYLGLCLACFFLVICRWIHFINPDVALLPEALLLHVTNFSLSLLCLSAFGFTVLLFGGKLAYILIAGLLIAAFNIAYELLFPLLNMRDPIDVLFGLLGVALASLYLIKLQKNGLIPK